MSGSLSLPKILKNHVKFIGEDVIDLCFGRTNCPLMSVRVLFTHTHEARTAGSEVTAGTVNIEGRLRVKVCKSGSATTMADILRLVEGAQGRAAPVQRLADTVAGKFAVGVMGCSLATLGFWTLAGPAVFPQVSDRSRVSQPYY